MELVDVAVALKRAGYAATDISEVGVGAWSSCFAFRDEGRDLVARFGAHLSDFEKDRFAARFSCDAMPVPDVELVSSYADGFVAVSTHMPGTPLEEVTGSEWAELVPAIVDLLEALRLADIPAGRFGG